jgi:hypothetical protein
VAEFEADVDGSVESFLAIDVEGLEPQVHFERGAHGTILQ